MSFSPEGGIEVAIVKGGQSDKDIVYIEDEDKKKSKIMKSNAIKVVECEDGTFEMLPNEKIRVIYICGSAGSGKSVWSAKFIKRYLKNHPKAKFYIFSQLAKDPAFDDLKPHRITLDESLIENPINIEEDINKHDLILFDDCSDNEKPLQEAIDNLETRLLVHGRKMAIQVLITSHLLNPDNSKHSRHRLNEMQTLVFFPQSGSSAQLTHSLKTQYGFSVRQVHEILQIENTRWIAITKIFPNILISEHFITFAKDIGKKK